jgi:hypothetical protein
VEIPVELPLDDGFLRRECPRCEQQFKWHVGPTEDAPADQVAPTVYFCPYCGEPAALDQWWTPDQLEYTRGMIAQPVMDMLAEQLGDAFKPLNSPRGLISVSTEVTHDEVGEPSSLHEPSDMQIVESPCHPWEPVKVPEGWAEPLHCLVCGTEFALA